jgi:hydroxymethylbilane synthase
MTAATPSLRDRTHKLRVGTRGSPLALIQTRQVIAALSAVSGTPIEEHPIRTSGDAVQDRRLADVGGKGLFAKEIHDALAAGRIDLAVHSLKDLETTLPPGIVLACTLLREDARDALILADAGIRADPADPFRSLPPGAVVGTASVRRQAQLLHARPDLRIVTLRGNVQTRLGKLAAGACDASLLAYAGLKRLGLAERAAVVLDPAIMLPAAGQGILGVTARADDDALCTLLATIEDSAARAVAIAERAMLSRLDGSCRTPIGAYALVLPDGALRLTGLVARADGSFLVQRSLQGSTTEAAGIGLELGERLRAESPADIFV